MALKCLVTGGGTGIGVGIAEQLAAAGHRVAVLGRRREPLDETVAELSAGGTDAIGVVTDVADLAQVVFGSLVVTEFHLACADHAAILAGQPDRTAAMLIDQ